MSNIRDFFNSEGILNNYNAIVDPAVTDDAGKGYSVGSAWINNNSDTLFRCLDSTPGAAIWFKQGTGDMLSDGSVPMSWLAMNERSAMTTPPEGTGRFWVRSDTPNVPMFTNDDDVDIRLDSGMVKLSNFEDSNISTLDFKDLDVDRYPIMYLKIISYQAEVSAGSLIIRASRDNGGSWDSAATDYEWERTILTSSGTETPTASINDSSIKIGGGVAAAGFRSSNADIYLNFYGGGIELSYNCSRINTTGASAYDRGAGITHQTSPTTAFQLLMNNGSGIQSIRCKLYGML